MTKQATLNDVRKAAAAIGATVEDERTGNHHECRVEAPKGHIWKSDSIHELIDSTNRPWKPDYADMLSRMAYGVEVCPDRPNCEWCDDDETEDDDQ